jgi:hypothetical protein
MRFSAQWIRTVSLALGLLSLPYLLAGCGPREPTSVGTEPAMRRLTEDQYRNIVADVFGPTITVGGRFDPLPRTDGLVALGARTVRITPSGFEQYYVIARSIAEQVVDDAHRDILIPCKPKTTTAADDACAIQFFSQAGRLLYRRPLTSAELSVAVTSAQEVATRSRDFYRGLAFGLAGFMVTPKFLFVIDALEPDPAKPGTMHLTGYARASKLSFLLWNSAPDDLLLKAAQNGELNQRAGLERQVTRMMQSPKLEAGVRAFFADFLDLQKFETLEKDGVIYPAFGVQAGEDAREQLMRVIIDHVIDRDLDYRDLYTTRHTFMTPHLSVIYRVPTGRPSGGWAPYDFPSNDPRAGITTSIGFLAVNSHPGRSSPTLRGRALRETVLCQKVPDPPGTVDFSVFNDPNSPHKTARERLTAHRTAPTCAGCHKITDPIGLALENFDGAGAARDMENGEQIDPSGDLDGIAFTDSTGLGKALHDNPAISTCLVSRLYAYAVGRQVAQGDRDIIAYFQRTFTQDGYRISRLLSRIALSDSFFKVDARAGTLADSMPTGGRL